MSVAGIIFGVVAIIVSFFGLLFGWIGGGVAAFLAALAILFGALSLKKGKGKGALIVGGIALILAVVMAISGSGAAKELCDKARLNGDMYTAETGKESLMAKYADKTNTSFGLLGFFLAIGDDVKNQADTNTIADQLREELDYFNKIDAAATAAPAVTTASATAAPAAETPAEPAPAADAPAVENTPVDEDADSEDEAA